MGSPLLNNITMKLTTLSILLLEKADQWANISKSNVMDNTMDIDSSVLIIIKQSIKELNCKPSTLMKYAEEILFIGLKEFGIKKVGPVNVAK